MCECVCAHEVASVQLYANVCVCVRACSLHLVAAYSMQMSVLTHMHICMLLCICVSTLIGNRH